MKRISKKKQGETNRVYTKAANQNRKGGSQKLENGENRKV